MMKASVTRAALALAAVAAPLTAAVAQTWVPGTEITGQTVQVTTNGVTDSVYFGPNGSATITSPGGKVVPATWSATGGNLCLSATGMQECWPYAQPFQAGQQVSLTSSCNSVSTWMAASTNAPPPPAQRPAGERG
jgi:hypothetical protein